MTLRPYDHLRAAFLYLFTTVGRAATPTVWESVFKEPPPSNPPRPDASACKAHTLVLDPYTMQSHGATGFAKALRSTYRFPICRLYTQRARKTAKFIADGARRRNDVIQGFLTRAAPRGAERKSAAMARDVNYCAVFAIVCLVWRASERTRATSARIKPIAGGERAITAICATDGREMIPRVHGNGRFRIFGSANSTFISPATCES